MMNVTKRLTCLILAVSVIFAAGFAATADGVKAEPSEVIACVRGVIDAHKSDIQSQNGRLLNMLPDEIAAADFNEYDTSRKILGTDLYGFNDAIPSVFQYMKTGNVEDEVSGKGNEIVTFKHGSYDVHSIVGLGGYPELFASDTVLRASEGGRVKLVKAYPEGIPDYQVVQNRRNIYVENVDFSGFSLIKFEFCENIIFNNCTFNDFSDNGLVFRGCRNVSVVNCSFSNCGNQMNDYTNSGYSIRIIGTEDNPAENILIENCKIDNPCGYAISLLDKTDNFVIRNNTITNSVWGAVHYWNPNISGNYVNVIENNECVNIGLGETSPNDADAAGGIGCSAIYAGRGMPLRKTVVKNNSISNAVENGIEGAYELVYHNSVKNTGENSAKRYTPSTEGIYITPCETMEQRYIVNDIETRGLRCMSLYSGENTEYNAIYIIGNSFNLKETDPSVICKYQRSDIEINCPKLKKLVIRDNCGMMTDKASVNIYLDKSYVMDYFDLDNKCMIGVVPERANYCYNINTY